MTTAVLLGKGKGRIRWAGRVDLASCALPHRLRARFSLSPFSPFLRTRFKTLRQLAFACSRQQGSLRKRRIVHARRVRLRSLSVMPELVLLRAASQACPLLLFLRNQAADLGRAFAAEF